MQELFNNYYHFELIWKNYSVNKYTLVQKLKDYKGFEQAAQNLLQLRPVLYHLDHVVVHHNKNKDEPLTILVPCDRENRVGFAKNGPDTIVFSTTPNYGSVEIFIIERRQISQAELLQMLQQGKLKIEMRKIREKALLNHLNK